VFVQNIEWIGGQNIEAMFDGLFAFLHGLYPQFKIKQLVADFIQDPSGLVWLTDIQKVKTIRLVKIASQEETKRISRMKERLTICAMCKEHKLCHEICYLLPNKSVLEAKINLCKRGIKTFFTLPNRSRSPSKVNYKGETNPEAMRRIEESTEFSKQMNALMSQFSSTKKTDNVKVCFECKRVIDEEHFLIDIQKAL